MQTIIQLETGEVFALTPPAGKNYIEALAWRPDAAELALAVENEPVFQLPGSRAVAVIPETVTELEDLGIEGLSIDRRTLAPGNYPASDSEPLELRRLFVLASGDGIASGGEFFYLFKHEEVVLTFTRPVIPYDLSAVFAIRDGDDWVVVGHDDSPEKEEEARYPCAADLVWTNPDGLEEAL